MRAVTEPTREQGGIVGAVQEIAERVSSLVRLEIELAQVEVKQKVRRIVVGAGLGLAAALVLLVAVAFGLAAAAAGLAHAVPLWAALLIVAGALLVLTAPLGALAARSFRGGRTESSDGR